MYLKKKDKKLKKTILISISLIILLKIIPALETKSFESQFTAAEKPLKLQHKFIIPNSLILKLNNQILQNKTDYLYNQKNSEIQIINPNLLNENITLYYRYFTLSLESQYKIYEISENKNIPAKKQKINLQDSQTNLNYFGSKTFSISVNKSGKTEFQQSLFLSFRGEITENINTEGILSDNQEGNSSNSVYLSQIERIYFRIFGGSYSAELGDINFLYNTLTNDYAIKSKGIKGFYSFNNNKLNGGFGESKSQAQEKIIPLVSGQYDYYLKTENSQKISIIPGSEKIFLNGKLLKEGERKDYTINYYRGLISLSSSLAFSEPDRLNIFFQSEGDSYKKDYLSAGGEFKISESFNLAAHYFSQKDNVDKSIEGNLSQDELDFLAEAQTEELYSNIDTLQSGEGEYIETEDVNGNKYFQYDPENGIYNVRFFYVGSSRGSYVKNENFFVYSGENSGDYDYQKILDFPEEIRNINGKAVYSGLFSSETYFYFKEKNLNTLNPQKNKSFFIKENLSKKIDKFNLAGKLFWNSDYLKEGDVMPEISSFWQNRINLQKTDYFYLADISYKNDFSHIYTVLGNYGDSLYKDNFRVEGGIASGKRFRTGINAIYQKNVPDSVEFKYKAGQIFVNTDLIFENSYLSYWRKEEDYNGKTERDIFEFSNSSSFGKYKWQNFWQYEAVSDSSGKISIRHFDQKLSSDNMYLQYTYFKKENEESRNNFKLDKHMSFGRFGSLSLNSEVRTSLTEIERKKYAETEPGTGDYTYDEETETYIYTPDEGDYILVSEYSEEKNLNEINLILSNEINFLNLAEDYDFINELPIFPDLIFKSGLRLSELNNHGSIWDILGDFPRYFRSEYSEKTLLEYDIGSSYFLAQDNIINFRYRFTENFIPSENRNRDKKYAYRVSWHFPAEGMTFSPEYSYTRELLNITEKNMHRFMLNSEYRISERRALRMSGEFKRTDASYLPLLDEYGLTAGYDNSKSGRQLGISFRIHYRKFSEDYDLLPISLGFDTYRGLEINPSVRYSSGLSEKTDIYFRGDVIYFALPGEWRKEISMGINIDL